MLKLFSPLTRINYSFIFFKYSSHSSGVRDVIIAIDNEMIKNAAIILILVNNVFLLAGESPPALTLGDNDGLASYHSKLYALTCKV